MGDFLRGFNWPIFQGCVLRGTPSPVGDHQHTQPEVSEPRNGDLRAAAVPLGHWSHVLPAKHKRYCRLVPQPAYVALWIELQHWTLPLRRPSQRFRDRKLAPTGDFMGQAQSR